MTGAGCGGAAAGWVCCRSSRSASSFFASNDLSLSAFLSMSNQNGAPSDSSTHAKSTPGTFFDGAMVHVVTTSTLDHLRGLGPASRFETPRFRPNLVIEPPHGAQGFVENGWIGRRLTIGGVELRIDRSCARCVMTTLAQGSLPSDPGVLRTVVQQNAGNVGVYASVARAGTIRRGDAVDLS